MVDLALLPGDVNAQAAMVSADGSTIVGTSNAGSGTPIHLFRWTATTGTVDLGGLPGQISASFEGISSDGSVVFGLIGIRSPGHATPFLWTAATGLQSVQDLLVQAGANLTGWTLTNARGLSADGNTMAGTGTDPNGNTLQVWIATLGTGGSPCNPPAAMTALSASVLPSARSVLVGETATAFVTIANAPAPGGSVACGVGIALASTIPASFSYQVNDCATNAPMSPLNTPTNIPVGGFGCYGIFITPSAPFGPLEVEFTNAGSNTPPAPTTVMVNTFLMSASLTQVPDIEAIAATSTPGLILQLPGPAGAGAFVVGTSNVGAGDVITASANTGSAVLPLGLSLCETDPVTSLCLSALGSSVTLSIAAGGTPTFGIFATAGGAIVNDPLANRIFVVFTDSGGVIRGRTSVAVTTQ